MLTKIKLESKMNTFKMLCPRPNYAQDPRIQKTGINVSVKMLAVY